MPQYATMEELTWRAVALKFWLPLDLDQSVKEADNTVLLAERDQLFNGPRGAAWDWAKGVKPAPIRVACLPPSEAKLLFLRRYSELVYQAATA